MVEVSSRADLIERKVDRAIADDIVVSREAGGVDIRKLAQVMEAAKLMSLSGSMVPAFLRENPGGCFGIVWKAYAWGLDPFAVASQAYEVKNKRTGETTVAYMSQLTHAIIEARAPIKKRLAVRYEGAGDDRVCIVSATFIGEDEPREYRSPRLGDRKPKPRNQRNGDDEDSTPGSPLWRTKPDLQQFYDASRDFARIYFPDVLLGIYNKDELEEVGYGPVAPPKPPPPDDGGLGVRLSQSALARAGFPAAQAAAAVDAALAARDNGGDQRDSLSVDQADGEAPVMEASPSAPGGPETPMGDPPAAQLAPDQESRPEGSGAVLRGVRHSRRRGRPSSSDGARLV